MFPLLAQRVALRVSSSILQRSSRTALVLLSARLPAETRLFSATTYQALAAAQPATKASSSGNKRKPAEGKTPVKAKTSASKAKTVAGKKAAPSMYH